MWFNLFFAVYLQIRIAFVNEFGVEEAGIDGGGIFKDFMENVTRAAFDVQYGLFKVANFLMTWINSVSLLLSSPLFLSLEWAISKEVKEKHPCGPWIFVMVRLRAVSMFNIES